MQANRVSAIVAMVIAAVVAVATAPSQAQTTAAQVRPARVRVAVAARPPARITVRKRSYLDPGTATKTHAEHYTDYLPYSLETGLAPRRDSTLFTTGPSLPFIHDRMPFPTCFDLPGFCQ